MLIFSEKGPLSASTRGIYSVRPMSNPKEVSMVMRRSEMRKRQDLQMACVAGEFGALDTLFETLDETQA